ncbi:ABC transporter ATP-binding protein [Pseudonocardia nigra]|uniref:ABC transporter ATP-binding protein n=1 Tax=Pseudonocardia nigra TaxID=1921578 RepID=UPI0027E21B8D|nr:ABC transporter ATP-binding protein [Pseudonocardia nigra]
MTDTPMIRLEELTKTYPGQDHAAVTNLSLDIAEGEIVVFVGPSGCGKTTTMKLINRIIEPTSGRIFLEGEDVTTVDADRLRRRIGYAIQQVGLFPHMTIAQNIATVPKMLGWSRTRIDERVDELLTLVRLDPGTYRHRFPKQLSGGQQQRVGVARALGADPSVMLMDEPFGAIDPLTRTSLQDEFLQVQRDIRKTIVFVTHDVDEAIKMGDRIAILREGAVVAQYDTPAAILTDPADEFVADFVGGGALIKRLSLTSASDAPVERWDTVTAGADPDATLAAVRRSERDYAVLVDDDQRPLGWIPRDIGASDAEVLHRGLPILNPVGPGDTLYDALNRMLGSHSSATLVVDDAGRYRGVLTMETLQLLMHSEDDRGDAPERRYPQRRSTQREGARR